MFYLVASARYANTIGPDSQPVPITVRVQDVNDNPPRLELFNADEDGEAKANDDGKKQQRSKVLEIEIVDGQHVTGPVVIGIQDVDRWVWHGMGNY